MAEFLAEKMGSSQNSGNEFQLIDTITNMAVNGEYTIPDITQYSEIGFMLYATYGCSLLQTIPSNVLINLNGINDYNRPLLQAYQAANNGLTILIAMVSSTKFRCDSIAVTGGWSFEKLEIYGKK